MKHAEATITVSNADGIHMRPASMISQVVMASGCTVAIRYRDQTADGADVLDILVLGIPHGATIQISSCGQGSETLIAKLHAMFADQFSLS